MLISLSTKSYSVGTLVGVANWVTANLDNATVFSTKNLFFKQFVEVFSCKINPLYSIALNAYYISLLHFHFLWLHANKLYGT